MIFDKLSRDVMIDDYFNQLYERLLKNIASIELVVDSPVTISEKQLVHLLRFSDILSNSTLNDCRNMAYRIVAFLSPTYKGNSIFKTYSTAILSRLGNFPAINNLNHNVELPFVREIETVVKKEIQQIPGAENKYFTDSQFDLFEKIKESNFYSFSGPTSMGKSFIIKTFIRDKISKKDTGNFVVIVPTRALINQFSYEIKEDLKELIINSNYKVTTNSVVTVEEENEGKRYILVLTPERLLSYISSKENPRINYLFVDEAHKLAAEKDYRSITMYLAIEKSMKKFSDLKIYFASPNVSNPEAFLELFQKSATKTFSTIESPVTQNVFFIDLISRIVSYYNEGRKYDFEDISISKYSSSFELIHNIGQSSSNVIYCNSVENTINKAKDFIRFLPNNLAKPPNPSQQELDELILETKKMIHKDYYLADCLAHGVAFHFGSLPQVIRNKVEKLFKKGEIKYLFCTSTLLEGVNLPAKNIFILSNKKHRSNMSKIDFWNLAGRAGRLNFELFGNVFCIREEIKDWKNTTVLNGKSTTQLQINATHQIDKNAKNIEQLLQSKQITSSEAEKEVLKYIANIISIDTIDSDNDYKSPIIKKLINDGKLDLLLKAQDNIKDLKIPVDVLNNNQSIMVRQQDNVYEFIVKNQAFEEKIKLPHEINYNNCVFALELLYERYNWDVNESKNDIANKNSLRYYALLVNQWINGQSLSEMINEALRFYERNNKKLMFYENNIQVFEDFNKSKRHINKVINNLISDIENVVRYKLEKYFNNYHAILVSILGEKKAGPNWNVFLEYGTRDTVAVYLQNMGFSRHVSALLTKEHRDLLNIKDGKLISIDKKKLVNRLVQGTPEYDEISMLI
ncbi:MULTISPECIES: DEAD/DEAH box helicase [unclassified Paenibacillus]|uniref:DEAD/DEAH box helicase n=1 Tax=unclassified Paenibacillus TaxID=185978 RepID=UPI0024059EAB|nr:MULTISPECIES: DEAD/DEAH box helicase [unclassified Paenibacillus]MDF9841473.1 POLQ-like helicase [Paenibacillus sp. PastF-2]MDF9848063.1 POLQ-like helicase [Paenibacillus sp. PastM-2]MDF9854632.1 POLQ-like helicase [Paenibacillus sp. PastF-1]MDH6479760.1 POLQ-like helicase [Paenibacillus sp. PastH-2]MDH6507338.1 POLQ-like helicase [Paenibacillus sp. PastM-3]